MEYPAWISADRDLLTGHEIAEPTQAHYRIIRLWHTGDTFLHERHCVCTSHQTFAPSHDTVIFHVRGKCVSLLYPARNGIERETVGSPDKNTHLRHAREFFRNRLEAGDEEVAHSDIRACGVLEHGLETCDERWIGLRMKDVHSPAFIA